MAILPRPACGSVFVALLTNIANALANLAAAGAGP